MTIAKPLSVRDKHAIIKGHDGGLDNKDIAAMVGHGATQEDIQEIIEKGLSYTDLTVEEKVGIKHGHAIGLPHADIAREVGIPVSLVEIALASGVQPKSGEPRKDGYSHKLNWQGKDYDVQS
jgi:hypothetical protein